MKSKSIFFSLIALALLAAGCNKNAINPSPLPANQTPPAASIPKTEATNAKLGLYKDYSPEAILAEQKAGQKVLLFFHAKWCPECKAIDADLKAHPEKVPLGLTVLKTDFDTEKELKKKYGVIVQHTFVQIDNDGNPIVKWISENAGSIAQRIK